MNHIKNGSVTFKKQALIFGMLPGILLYFCFFVVPSLFTFIFSFTDINQVPNMSWHFIGLQNYKEFFFQSNTGDLLEILANSLVFCIATTVIQTVFSLFLSNLLCLKFIRGRDFYRTVIFLPTILGVTVTGLCFKMFLSIDGPVESVLKLFGTSSGMFGDQNIVFALVIFCQIWMSAGYEMVIFIAGLQAIPEELHEAALIDGANERQSFFYVTLPQLWPTVMVNLLICLIGSLSSFQIILITTGGSKATDTLAMYVYQIAFGVGTYNGTLVKNIGRQGFAASLQMVLFAGILLVTVVSRYFMNKVNGEEDSQ